MATVPAATAGPKKLSFAKVVASKPKENIPIVSATRVAVPTMEHRVQPPAASTNTTAANKGTTPTSTNSPIAAAKSPPPIPKDNGVATTSTSAEVVDSTKSTQGGKDLQTSLSAASVSTTPSLVVNGSSPSMSESQSKNDTGTVSDDASQRADSNSEMGTKAPSLDGKSITSGTTFALDEKESLRPDDSASVKASAEDDEAFSIRGSLIANSRPALGSEVARIHRLRLGDMPERRIIQMIPESQDQGVTTPQSVASSQPPPVEQPQTLGIVNGSSDAFTSMYGQNPDEKLLEAMQSPKDRIFLLRLEQEVINFVQSSKEPYMDLPPNNSFCRMLTHKLADYYHMTHSFEAVQGSVRIFRTPFCRVPPSLASIVGTNTNTTTTTTPPQLLPKKIMRRGEDGGSGQASTSPSKATSEVGSDGKEKSGQTKEKLTREEREEAYNKARERIFGSSEKQGEPTPDDDANGVSRASSVSAKDKSNLGKRGKTGKQRRDDSESFDSRSQYQPYYHPHQPGWTPQYIPVGHPQYNSPVQQPYQNPMPQAFPPPAQAYPAMVPNNAYPQYANMPVYGPPAQPTPPRYPPSNGSVAAYGGPVQNPPPQPWQPTYPSAQASSPYQSRAPQPQPPGNPGSLGIPYAFGQLPANANPHDPKSQHPIPGSYNRHAFNPKTQSFVPSNGMIQVQPPMPPYNMGGHGSPQVGSPHLAYSGFNSPAPPQPYVGGPGYGMSRQGSNNSLPPYPQHLPQHAPAHLPQAPPQMPNKPSIPPPTGPGQTYSHLTTFGNPALPQKPPTGI
ncbi:uncharacterized protein F4822DRAFT_202207 [Hypoxylon trugodes]|uniref:uncharacterized protein n=1 Tax=Hypoxylon trugodes TaxID=326681 RepID=UPI002199041A|nr:uncharacterized protein F4822DRAFT_202207 [Hypoxylon trugodes]KAI1389480.1 hypothetical protein F4822DRAFT_202207 [Hypoxylon trugodes]